MVDITTHYFVCGACPICEELERRIMPVVGECGFQYDHCGCCKVGDEFFKSGYCEDAFVEKEPSNGYSQRKTGREYRRKMRRRKLRKAYGRRHYSGCHDAASINDWVCGEFGQEGEEQMAANSHILYPRSSANKVFFKRVSNKAVRRSKDLPLKGNEHRKIFDYWWTII